MPGRDALMQRSRGRRPASAACPDLGPTCKGAAVRAELRCPHSSAIRKRLDAGQIWTFRLPREGVPESMALAASLFQELTASVRPSGPKSTP